MGVSNFSRFPHGVAIDGLPILNTYGGAIFWVDGGSDLVGVRGAFERPFATIQAAVNRCVSGRGDIIVVKPGHTETVSSPGGITVDKAAVSILGLGQPAGSRPSITYGAADATFAITADDVTIYGLQLAPATLVNGVVTVLDISAQDCRVINNDVPLTNATYQALNFITTGSDTDRLVIEGNHIYAPDAGATYAIRLGGVPKDVVLRGNHITGDFANACIFGTTAATGLVIEGNYLRNTNSGSHAIELTGAATGIIQSNTLVADTVSALIDRGACEVTANRYPGHEPMILTGEADIDVSQADYTSAQALITIAPEVGIRDAWLVLDLAKATTGFAAVHTTETIEFAVKSKPDGTNWRTVAGKSTSAVSGTDAAELSECIHLGPIGVDEQMRIDVTLSAEAGDTEIPYLLYADTQVPPALTAVAAA